MTTPKDDYDLQEKIKIQFKGMPYYVMPRYRTHYLDNDYEKFSLQILKNNLGAGKVFLDIGAHYGAYSLYAAKAAGSKVFAIEPVNENYELLTQNVKANKLDQSVSTYNYAVSDENGEAEFNIPWASDSAGFYEHPNAETIRKQKVQIVKIDDLLPGEQVDLIKIDTEGHEVSVLKGLKDTLKNNPQAQLIIELNPACLTMAGKSVEELLSAIDDLQKDIYIVDEDAFSLIRLTGQLQNWENYVAKSGYANLYCVPRSKDQQYMLAVSHSPNLDGAEKALLEQVSALREAGCLSHVIVPTKGPFQETLTEKGISHSVVDGYSFWVKSEGGQKSDAGEINFRNIKASAAIAGIAEHIKPTIIANNTIVNPWGCAAARTQGLPLVWMIHEYGDIDHCMPFLHDLADIRSFVVSESDAVLCCSESVRRTMLKAHGAQAAKIHTTYNLLDAEAIVQQSSQKIKPPFPAGPLKLCIVGTIKEQKGQALAIEALHTLKQEHGIKAELLIIGEGKRGYVNKLKALVKDLKLTSQVNFAGRIDNPYPYLKAADAVLVCSFNEAFGRVAAEAMILGVPVIGANSGGTAELLSGGAGILFESQNSKDLASKINKFKSADTDSLVKTAQAKAAKLLDKKTNLDKLMQIISGLNPDKDKLDQQQVLSQEWVQAMDYAAEMYMSRKEQAEALRQLTLDNEHLKAANDILRNDIDKLVHSRSWKVTKPLRGSVHVVKKLKK